MGGQIRFGEETIFEVLSFVPALVGESNSTIQKENDHDKES